MKYKQVNRKESYTAFFALRKKLYETKVFQNKIDHALIFNFQKLLSDKLYSPLVYQMFRKIL